MRKLSAKWVPKCLNADRKRQRCQSFEQIWNFFGAIKMISYRARLVTMDKTWLYHYDPETKQQSMEWRRSGSPRPKKIRVQKSIGKVLASIFWDQDGILIIDFLPKGQTINAEYYSSLLVQMKGILKEKFTPREGHQGGLFLARQCPGSPGTCNPEETGLPGLSVSYHLPYSPDLAPSDYHLFPGLKKQLQSCHFSSDAEVISAAETWLDGHRSEFVLSGLQKLEQRAKKCIELRGEYVE